MSGMHKAIMYLVLEDKNTKLSYNLQRCLIKRERAGYGAFLDDYRYCFKTIKPNDD